MSRLDLQKLINTYHLAGWITVTVSKTDGKTAAVLLPESSLEPELN